MVIRLYKFSLNVFLIVLLCAFKSMDGFCQTDPMPIGVIGLTHTHVHWIFGSEKQSDFKIIGIVEPNLELAKSYSDQYGFSMDIVYPSMDAFFKVNKPEAVCAFGTIYDHLEVVEKAAPLGIHIMVEKPLAVSLEHAKKMKHLAETNGVHLLTNYETTWYPTVHKAKEFIERDSIGPIKKVIIRDGHKGPKKIGVNKEFLDWLIDPKYNGGGAITDFGCYGANIMTWLMDGERPSQVTAVTQQLQQENNPLVDDDATIILTYKDANAVIQASWDWTIGRKDMEIYGLKGVVYADNKYDLRVRMAKGYDGYSEKEFKLGDRTPPFHDPFSMFVAVIRNEVSLGPNALSSLENNMIVMEILDAATTSAKHQKTITLD